jgi:hypothetical protein
MKQEKLQDLATALRGLTDPEVRKLSEYWAASTPEKHWIRTRGGLFLISMIRDCLRAASH